METRSKSCKSFNGENYAPTYSSMNLRSRKRVTYSVDIDFDEASREWNSNKRRLDNGCYEYCTKLQPTTRIVTRSQNNKR